MKWGGALSSFSDGSLLVRTRIDANRRDGIFHVDPRTGYVEELECPAAGAFCALPVTGDRLLVATPGASHALLWNPLTHQIDRVAGEIPHGNWVCSDVYKGAVTIVANQDLSGSAAGFDYEHHQTSLAVFDPEQGQFVQPFQRVEGQNLQGIVVQSETHLLGYAFGRHSPFCSLFSSDLKEADSGDRPLLRLPFDEWLPSVRPVGVGVPYELREVTAAGSCRTLDARLNVIPWGATPLTPAQIGING